jgi:hypothetical protein
VATGAISGITVIDIDPRNGGHEWLHANRDRLPVTRAHRTPGCGPHLIYNFCPGLRNIDIAPGVQIKNTGGYVIWWPVSPHKWPVLVLGPVADFPSWIAAEAGDVTTEGGVLPFTFHRGSNHLQATASAFLRSKYLLLDLERCPVGNRHKLLYWTACRFGNMIGEGKMKWEVAEHLLVGAAKANGLWRDDPDNCLVTIRDGLREGKDQWIAAQSKREDFPPNKELAS